MSTNPLKDRLEKLPTPPKIAVTIRDTNGERSCVTWGPWSGQVDPFYRVGADTPFHEESFGYSSEHEDTGLELHRMQDFSDRKKFTMGVLLATTSSTYQRIFNRWDTITTLRLTIEEDGHLYGEAAQVDEGARESARSRVPVSNRGWVWAFWRGEQRSDGVFSSRIDVVDESSAGKIYAGGQSRLNGGAARRDPRLFFTSPIFLLRAAPGGPPVTGQANQRGGFPFRGEFGCWALWDRHLDDATMLRVANSSPESKVPEGPVRREGFDTGWGVAIR